LIISLLDAKLSYREIARIAKCSQGSVHAELVAYKKEKEAAEKIKMAQLQDSIKTEMAIQPSNDFSK
jgi:hypothetical protein